MSFSKSQVSFSSNFASLFTIMKLGTFLGQTLYTLLERSLLKCTFLKYLSSRVKIRQIPHVNFDTTINSSPNFLSFFIVMTHNSSGSFKLIHFLLWVKGSHQSSSFETFKCSGGNLPYSSSNFPNHKSI